MEPTNTKQPSMAGLDHSINSGSTFYGAQEVVFASAMHSAAASSKELLSVMRAGRIVRFVELERDAASCLTTNVGQDFAVGKVLLEIRIARKQDRGLASSCQGENVRIV